MLDWRFLHPWFLILLPLPLLWLGWHYWRRARRSPSILFSSLECYRKGGSTWRITALRSLPIVRALVLILGIVALARPQYGQVERQRAALGVDIALAIDVSQSMQHNDFAPNRLEAAKARVQEFVAARDSDRITVVIFGSTAALLIPPTFDQDAISSFVASIRNGMIDNERTAIGMGLSLAVDKLKDSEAKSKVVVLLTDGENNAGTISPIQAAEAAKALDVRVYTIGVGSKEPPRRGFFSFGAPSLDEETLREIAETTGGRYFRATNEGNLKTIYDEIDQLEQTEIEVNEYEDYDERFMWFWLPALGLFGIEFLLRGFALTRLP